MGDAFECDRCKKVVGGRKQEYRIRNYWDSDRKIFKRTASLELCEQCYEEVTCYRIKLENEFDDKWDSYLDFAMNKPEPKKKWYQRRK